MKNVDFYMDEARRVAGLSSDRQLAKALGIAQTGPNYWRARKTWPSEDHMIALAKLAGIDPGVALIDLATWRAKEPATQKVWASLRAMVATLALPFFVTVAPADHAHSAVCTEARVSEDCILWKVIRRLRGWFLSYENPACAHA